MRSARPYLQIPPRRPTNHVFTRLEHTSTSTQAEAIELLAERMHKVEDSLGDWRFGRNVVLSALFAGLVFAQIPARKYREVVRKVDLLYTTMQPQVKETKRLQRIEKAQKKLDECVREQQQAQKTIDVYAEELRQLKKGNERK